MNILLINSPIRLNAKPNCIPYGLAVIASVLRNWGHDVRIYDINAHRHSRNEVLDILKTLRWDAVGVSGLITTWAFQRWLIPELKKMNPLAPVIAGGGLATTCHAMLFEETDLDIAVLGEGEATMAELASVLEKKGSLKTVRGIVYRDKEGVHVTDERENIADLDGLPFPAWDLLPMDIYLKNPIWGDVAGNSSGFRRDITINRSMNIISSRGCPFSCRYCYHLFGRSSYRYRSPANIVAEMEVLVKRYDVDFIGFVDDNMMASEQRLREFCELLMKQTFKVFWGCHGRVTSAKPEILRLMAEAGCVWIGYGIESGSQIILDAMNKKTDVAKAKAAIIETRRAGIFPNTTFIYGYPGETLETIRETIAFKKELGLECGSFFANPYPETDLYSTVSPMIEDEREFIERLGDATEFVLNLTGFDDDSLFELKKAYDMKEDLDSVLKRISDTPGRNFDKDTSHGS